MAAKKVGALIKEARTAAGMTQEGLAKKVKDCTASDISKAERGEKELTDEQLKAIAKATGVTQKSLLEAPKGGTSSTAKKTAATKATTTAAKKTTTTAAKKTTSKKEELTTREQKLLRLFREADSDTKTAVMNTLEGKSTALESVLQSLLGADSKSSSKKSKDSGLLGTLLSAAAKGDGIAADAPDAAELLSSLLKGNK